LEEANAYYDSHKLQLRQYSGYAKAVRYGFYLGLTKDWLEQPEKVVDKRVFRTYRRAPIASTISTTAAAAAAAPHVGGGGGERGRKGGKQVGGRKAGKEEREDDEKKCEVDDEDKQEEARDEVGEGRRGVMQTRATARQQQTRRGEKRGEGEEEKENTAGNRGGVGKKRGRVEEVEGVERRRALRRRN